jgi:hypothetical protein
MGNPGAVSQLGFGGYFGSQRHLEFRTDGQARWQLINGNWNNPTLGTRLQTRRNALPVSINTWGCMLVGGH